MYPGAVPHKDPADRAAYQRAYKEANAEKLGLAAKVYRDGRTEQAAEYSKAYRQVNADKLLALQRAYRERFASEVSEYQRVYREAHSEQISASHRRYRDSQDGAELRRGHAMKRRARIAGAKIEDVLPQRVLVNHQGICGICGEAVGPDYHVDHIIPLSRGGLHSYDNVQPSHPFCNMSKGSKLPEECLPSPPWVAVSVAVSQEPAQG